MNKRTEIYGKICLDGTYGYLNEIQKTRGGRMKTYENLTGNQKAIFDRLEGFFQQHSSVNIKDWVTVLGVLLNKYKR